MEETQPQQYFTITEQQVEKIFHKLKKSQLSEVTKMFNIHSIKYKLISLVDAVVMLGQSSWECDRGAGMEEYNPKASYENLAGNTQQGDGVKFKGRGFIQLTSRKNYQNFENDTGHKVVENPNIVAQNAEIAVESLFWYFSKKQIFRNDQKLTQKVIDRASSLVNCGVENKVANHQKQRIEETEFVAKVFGLSISIE